MILPKKDSLRLNINIEIVMNDYGKVLIVLFLKPKWSQNINDLNKLP
jgi:hypothetical protein